MRARFLLFLTVFATLVLVVTLTPAAATPTSSTASSAAPAAQTGDADGDGEASAMAAPVADDASTYGTCGRVFPDPQAYWPSPSSAPGESPWAKGNGNCRAVDFLGWAETLSGLDFLASEDMFGEFVEVYNLGEEDDLENTVENEFDDVLDAANGEGMTAGLPTEDLGREKVPMYLVRVTDEQDATIPVADREHFVYTLGIHGIERAGVEGGIRAAEDLATWASCEKHGDEESAANCAQEEAGPDNPHPILETMPEGSLTAGDALKQSSVWFVLSNPDGWRRGDKQDGGFFYQRYNGNGVDMNRDWPTRGFTFRPYTPWSEPETRATGKVLKDVKDSWTGGIDLHGQLIDRAFSFTLIGGAERPFDKDRRVLQFVKGAWADAEERLQWSSLIKPNDAPEDDPRVYGVQWGTIWDTIAYTVTGALGDWIDSDLGLDADGIDNEMSLSHLSNCGIGTCWIPEAEQLHVDGNKSLIYAMMHYSLENENTTFGYRGKAAYLHNPARITHEGSQESTAPEYTDLPQQEGESFTINHTGEETTQEFEVQGPDQGVYNGGLRATVTWNNVTGVSAGSLNEIAIDMRRSDEEDPQRGEQEGDEWQTQNSYFNQAPTYLQSGAQLDVNSPEPGTYRVRISGAAPSQFDVDLEYLPEQAWPDPGQLPYDVSNMDFFSMLEQHVPSSDKLTPVPVDDVLAGNVDLSQFDTVVAADQAFLPGFVESVPGTDAQETETATVNVPAPGAGERSDATSAYYEFDIEQPQGSLNATVTSDTVVDPDLYLQVQLEDGSWSGDLAAGETGRTGIETLSYPGPVPGHYRLEIHNWAGAPGPADVEIVFEGREEVVNTSDYTAEDRDEMARIAREFVEQGGNFVLTDDSLRAFDWMNLAGSNGTSAQQEEDSSGAVEEQKVYAGHVQFTADGGSTTTYDDPLAANVDQPGAAEGSGNRHQVAEPVPTGYAIQDESGGDLNSHPQWYIDRTAFEEDAGGRVVGMVGENRVTFGEVPLGDGVVRVLGSLLPMPTEEFDHPYGLDSYGVTYSGYEVFRNMLDWTNPNATAAPPIEAACTPVERVPDSGFTDTDDNTHHDNIECIAWYEITHGQTETTYAPRNPVVRAQIASFMARLLVEGGVSLPADPPDAFEDDDDSVHEYNINALAALGLIEGVGDSDGNGEPEFAPRAPTRRDQMAAFVARAHEHVTGSLPEPSRDYFDDDDGNTHEDAINALAELNVIQGRQDVDDADGDGDTDENLFFPSENVGRDQMASFIVHDLGHLVALGHAYFGGARVTLEATTASAGGDVSGKFESHKDLLSLTANGCGNDGEDAAVAGDGSFSVDIGEGQSEQCTLTLTATTRMPGVDTDGQRSDYPFTITIE